MGFQPLQIIWNRKIVDAIFRGGKKHSNYGHTVVNMVTDLVKLIRRDYDENVVIILRMDRGFFDQINLEAFDKLCNKKSNAPTSLLIVESFNKLVGALDFPAQSFLMLMHGF